jgi:hypothetical protein
VADIFPFTLEIGHLYKVVIVDIWDGHQTTGCVRWNGDTYIGPDGQRNPVFVEETAYGHIPIGACNIADIVPFPAQSDDPSTNVDKLSS